VKLSVDEFSKKIKSKFLDLIIQAGKDKKAKKLRIRKK